MIFYSVVIGLIGPTMVITVPPIRKSLGYRPAEPIPTSFPGECLLLSVLCACGRDGDGDGERGREEGGLARGFVGGATELMTCRVSVVFVPVPNRPRRPVQGYEDE